jgi:NAD(P)-dependent dehydrogenase (short-subunit alcohol dehydrogenase family)
MKVIITGGTGKQFGADIVSAFLKNGATVTIFTRSKRVAETVIAKNYGSYINKIFIEEVNYAELATLTEAVDRAAVKMNGIDCLINSAATAKISAVEKFELDEWNKVMHLNVAVPLFLSKECRPYMMESKNASILNISSIYGARSPKHYIYEDSGLNSPINYGASKAALQYITQYLSTYWAPYIRVNCLIPGGYYNNQPESFVKNYIKQVPLGRMAKEGDLGNAAYFLCSKDACYITGQCLAVDGGWLNW